MTKFKGKVQTYGNSYVIRVPADYVHHGILKLEETRWFEIGEKVKDGGGEK